MLCKSASETAEPLTCTLLATSNLVPGFLRASTFSSVVLPLPEGPIRAVSVPNPIQRECSLRILGQRTSLGISVYLRENERGSSIALPAAFFDLYATPGKTPNGGVGQVSFVTGIAFDISERTIHVLHLSSQIVKVQAIIVERKSFSLINSKLVRLDFRSDSKTLPYDSTSKCSKNK